MRGLFRIGNISLLHKSQEGSIMGDPTCEQSNARAVESDISCVDIDNASLCKVNSNGNIVMTVPADGVPEAGYSRKEESIESSVGTEALTDASAGEDVNEEGFPGSVLTGVRNGKPEEESDAGSTIPSDSLHSFFSLLFDETASKLDEFNDSDDYSEEKEDNRQSGNAKSNHTQQPLKEKQSKTELKQTENVPARNEHRQTPVDGDVESQQREKTQSETMDSKRAILRRGHLESRLVLDVSDVKKELEKEVEQKHPEANRKEQENSVLFHSKSQTSLELCDVFDRSLTSDPISSSTIGQQTEALASSRREKFQQRSRARTNSQDEAQKVGSVQEKKTSSKRHSNAAEVNEKWNSFHGGTSQPSKQKKASSVRPPSELQSSSSHGQSLRSKLAKHASISSFFSHDRRRLAPSKPYPTKEVVNGDNMEYTSARLDKIKEKEVSTGDDLDSFMAFGMDDTDRVSNLLDKKESAKGREAAEAVAHRRDELIDSIRQSLHNGDGLQNLRGPVPRASKRQDRPKEDLLASSSHSQASYFRAPKRVTAAAESIRKLAYKAKETAKVGASKAKETAKVGAMLATKATVTATKTARATVMAPAYAASYVVNLKGKNTSNDPPADDSNVDPALRHPAQHIDPNNERHGANESIIEDLRGRKSAPHRQRSGNSESRKRPSSRHRASTETSTRANPSRQNSDSDRPRIRSRSTASSRHRSNEDKISTRSRSARRDREDSTENHNLNRDRNGDKNGAGTRDSRSRSNRHRREDDTKSSSSKKNEPSCSRSGEDQSAASHRSTQIRPRPCYRGSDEKSTASRSQGRGRSDDRNNLSQHRSRSRRRADDSGTVASSRSRASRSVSRRRAGDLDESTHRTRRRGRSLRRSDPPGLAADYEKEEKPTDSEPQVREYRGRSKSNGPRRKRRTSLTK